MSPMQNKVFKPTVLMPRSIPRTVRRFFQQLRPQSEQRALEEFRISRQQAIVSMQCLFYLVVCPLFITWGLKTIIIGPGVHHFWNSTHQPIFLNSGQEHRAFLQLQDYVDRRFFDKLVSDEELDASSMFEFYTSLLAQPQSHEELRKVAQVYNAETITIVTNIVSDLCFLVMFVTLYFVLRPQRQILVRFITDTLYGFSDTAKAFLVLLGTDLLVGYHSPIGWVVSLEALLHHFGFAPHENLVLLMVATVPVFLSTVFKYGIFRYLNRISPSTVAIYHNMIE